jgi:hypothetical protein
MKEVHLLLAREAIARTGSQLMKRGTKTLSSELRMEPGSPIHCGSDAAFHAGPGFDRFRNLMAENCPAM